MNGTIVRIITDKGFGFIQGNENGRDYFFHKSSMKDLYGEILMEFARGLKVHVTFDPVDSPRGLRADNVRLK